MSHWSSEPTIWFLPQGAAVRALGMLPTLWNWKYLLVKSRYNIANILTYYLLQRTAELMSTYYTLLLESCTTTFD